MPFKIKSTYIDYITVKTPQQLVKIFEEYSPYYSPLEYIGNNTNNTNITDIVSSNDILGNIYNFKINKLENIDELLDNYKIIRKFNNVGLLPNVNNYSINTKWDLNFDILFDNNNLHVIHSLYNTNRDEDLSSFFRDAFLRTREDLYIEENGITHNIINSSNNSIESIYKFLLILSNSYSEDTYNYNNQFEIEFDKPIKQLSFTILEQILQSINFPNINLCLTNLTNYMKTYFLSKDSYLYDCLNIKTFLFPAYLNVYGVFSSYSDETKITNGELTISINNTINMSNVNNKDIIEIINNFVLKNSENKLYEFAKLSSEENNISCITAFYNIIENNKQKGYGANLYTLNCIGQNDNDRIILAYIIQVSSYSKNNNSEIDDFHLKYLFIWNNKDTIVYDKIDTLEIMENFRNYFLKPIFQNSNSIPNSIQNPIQISHTINNDNIQFFNASNSEIEPNSIYNSNYTKVVNPTEQNKLKLIQDEKIIPEYNYIKPYDNPSYVKTHSTPNYVTGVKNDSDESSKGHIEIGGKKNKTKKIKQKNKTKK